MKKLMIAAAIVCAAAFAQAASIGWSAMGLAAVSGTEAGASYKLFVYNTSADGADFAAYMKTITDALDLGGDVSSYEFASGTVPASGTLSVTATTSGKTIKEEGTWSSFMVIFDNKTPVSGESNYAVISGGANQTKTISATTTSALFGAGNVATYISDSSHWASFGPEPGPEPVPEPTSAMLLLLGVAGLALKRKQA